MLQRTQILSDIKEEDKDDEDRNQPIYKNFPKVKVCSSEIYFNIPSNINKFSVSSFYPSEWTSEP